MKNIKLLVGVAVLTFTFLPAIQTGAQNNPKKITNEFSERDEIRQTFRLSADAQVEVSNIRGAVISGAVEIETANIEFAKVEIIRSAQNRNDLEEYKINIENTPKSLIIRGETRPRNAASAYELDVRHQVKLTLPRRVNLSIKNVVGKVQIGDVLGNLSVANIGGSLVAGNIDGQVQISVVTGNVNVGQASRQVEIKSVSGDVKIARVFDSLDLSVITGAVSVRIESLGESGAEINSVSGKVELQLKNELNAQLIVNNVSGKISFEIPNVTVQSRESAYAMRALIGKGGPPISINIVTNDVRLIPSK